MEIESCDNLTYWQIKDKGDYCSLSCPLLEADIYSFGIKRGILTELKRIEKWMQGRYMGWNAYTKLKNAHIMRMLWKLGAKPYHMDLDADSIWFVKKIRSSA